MKQWTIFATSKRPQGRGEQAMLEQNTGRITLESAARVWDPSGSTTADVIHMDSRAIISRPTGMSPPARCRTREPQLGLLSGDEPVQATAQHMVSTNHRALIVYEGKADMWQGASRIRADRIEIDREARPGGPGSVRRSFWRKRKGTPSRPRRHLSSLP